MKAESLQKPIANYTLTFIDKNYVEVEFFDNIQTKTKQEEGSKEPITIYEFDHYRITIRNRHDLENQIKTNYNEWLQYAISKDDSVERIPTELEIVQAQYKEYEGMDTPSTIEEMKQVDPAMATEYLNMMIELRNLIYTLSAQEKQSVGYTSIHIPVPSKNLEAFKNKFKLTK